MRLCSCIHKNIVHTYAAYYPGNPEKMNYGSIKLLHMQGSALKRVWADLYSSFIFYLYFRKHYKNNPPAMPFSAYLYCCPLNRTIAFSHNSMEPSKIFLNLPWCFSLFNPSCPS